MEKFILFCILKIHTVLQPKLNEKFLITLYNENNNNEANICKSKI